MSRQNQTESNKITEATFKSQIKREKQFQI